MPSIRRFLTIVLAAVALGALVGCASEVKRTDGYTRPASSASIRFYIPERLTISIQRYGYNYVPAIDDRDRALASREVRAMLKSMEIQLNARLFETLAQTGLKTGDDLVIAVDVERATHIVGPGVEVNVRALFKNPPAGSPVWSVKMELSKYRTPEEAATAFVDKLMREIQSTNMIGPPVKK